MICIVPTTYTSSTQYIHCTTMTNQHDVSSVVLPAGAELPARVSDFLAREHNLLIGGEWLDAASGATFDTLDPATGRVLASVASGGAVDVDRAVAPRAAPSATTPGSGSGPPSAASRSGGWPI